MATLVSTASLNLSSEILQVSGIQFSNGSIQTSAVQDVDGSIVVDGYPRVKNLNFINGGGLVSTNYGNTTTVYLTSLYDQNIKIKVQDEGTTLTNAVTSINFIGTGVSANSQNNAITVNIPGTTSGAGISAPVVTNTVTVSGKSDYTISGFTNNAAENYLVFLDGVMQRPNQDFYITRNTVNLLPVPLVAYTLTVLAYQLPVGAGNGYSVKDNGDLKSTSSTTLNFTGAGVSVTTELTGTTSNIVIPGNNSIQAQKDNNTLKDVNNAPIKVTSLNFLGSNISLTTNNLGNNQYALGVQVLQNNDSGNINGITISKSGLVIGSVGGVTDIQLQGLGIGASTTALSNNIVRVEVPGTMIQDEGIDKGFVNTINFVGGAIIASVGSNGVATVVSSAIKENESMRVLNLTADSLNFPANATTTLTTQLTSKGEYLVVKVNGVNKAIKLFDIGQ